MYIYINMYIYQASAYEKQVYAKIPRIVMKFRGYRHAKSHTPLTKYTCDNYFF